MIKITIEKFTSEEYKETQNFVVKRTPTEQRKKSSSMYSDGSEKVVFIEESEPREVTKRQTIKVGLLQQEIENDSDFDLGAVIKAINNL